MKNASPVKSEVHCVAVLQSIHYVIKGEQILKRAGLQIDVIPIPRDISSDCGMALEFSSRDKGYAEKLLAEASIVIVGIYASNGGLYSRM